MAALNVVGYKPGNSILHRLDSRTKQIMVMVQSTACFLGDSSFLSLVTVCLLYCIIESGIGVLQTIREIRYFMFFLLFVFVVRTVTLDENFIPIITVSQVQAAGIFCWRLLLIVLMGVLLISTTRTGAIRAALVWGLRPVPFVNERTAATMVGLIVRMVPLMLFQSGEIGDAMRARCIEGRRQPIYRMTRFTILLFQRAIIRADDLVDTMQARCYNEYRTMRTLHFSRNDILAAAIGLAVLLTIFIK